MTLFACLLSVHCLCCCHCDVCTFKFVLVHSLFDVKDGRSIRDIRKHFQHWLRDCHEKFDKEVHFIEQTGSDRRRENVESKRRQHPWCVYQRIELDGKTYQSGDVVSCVGKGSMT